MHRGWKEKKRGKKRAVWLEMQALFWSEVSCIRMTVQNFIFFAKLLE